MLVGFGEWWEVAAETSLQARVHEHFLMSMCFPEAEYEQSLPQRSSASVRRSTLLKGLVCMIVRVGWICPSRFAEGMFARSAPTKTPAASPPCFVASLRESEAAGAGSAGSPGSGLRRWRLSAPWQSVRIRSQWPRCGYSVSPAQE